MRERLEVSRWKERREASEGSKEKLTGTAMAAETRKAIAVFRLQCLGSANHPPAGDQTPAFAGPSGLSRATCVVNAMATYVEDKYVSSLASTAVENAATRPSAPSF